MPRDERNYDNDDMENLLSVENVEGELPVEQLITAEDVCSRRYFLPIW